MSWSPLIGLDMASLERRIAELQCQGVKIDVVALDMMGQAPEETFELDSLVPTEEFKAARTQDSVPEAAPMHKHRNRPIQPNPRRYRG